MAIGGDTRRQRRRLGTVAGVLLAGALLLVPGAAEAKKVTASAAPVLVPDAAPSSSFPTVYGEAAQTFTLGGKKVKRKQVLDVNLVLNATEPAPFTFASVRIFLIGPRGDLLAFLNPSQAPIWAGLKLDDQSDRVSCNPATIARSTCNYWQGQTATGSVHATINPTFKGSNPKGTWTLLFQDQSPGDDPPTAIGVSTLEVTAGRKFEKEPK